MGQRRSLTWTISIAVLATVPATAQAQPPAIGDLLTAPELKQRFGEQEFFPHGGFMLGVGQKLPDLVWQHPDSVAKVVDDIDIPTRWFNERFEEVETANEPGRYYVYGEGPVPAGPVLRRAMTCCCVAKDVNLTQLAERSIKSRVSESAQNSEHEQIEAVLRRWRTTEEGAVELAELLDPDQATAPARIGQWHMENASRHVQLKRKLLGLEGKPLARATPEQLHGDPAPELRKAPLGEAEITEDRVREIETKLDQWYASSSEPMAVVIARNGVIVAAKGYGTLRSRPVTIDTPMKLDSAMKPLIGLQLATYVDRGFIKLDEPIGNYLSDFGQPEDSQLTFRAAHAHLTGIHFPWSLAFSRLFYFHAWHESLIAHCQREWKPGTRHRYGVVGVILSVRALELLRGRNYWDAMERDLFKPLGIRNVLPGGVGFSAESMARIGVVLANRGKYGKWEVISEATHAAILPTSLKPWFPEVDMKYGIGLQDQSRLLGPGSYGHAGGCGTLLAINPQNHLVLAMARNARGENYREQLSQLAALLRTWINANP